MNPVGPEKALAGRRMDRAAIDVSLALKRCVRLPAVKLLALGLTVERTTRRINDFDQYGF